MGIRERIVRMLGGEVRSSAGVPSYGMIPPMGSVQSASGMLVSQATAMAVSAVNRAVKIRAQDVARAAASVVRTDSNGTHTKLGRNDHPVAGLLVRPNRVQTWYEYMRDMMVAYLLRGNAYSAVLRDKRGNPTELVWINPDAVMVLEAVDGSWFYNVNRIGLFQIAMLRDFPPAIPAEDVLHIRDVSFNMLVSASTIGMARDAIGLAMGQGLQASRWVNNGARPSGVLQTDRRLSQETAERLKKQWDEFQSGVQNTGKTAVLEEGLKWEKLQLSAVDIQFIDQQQLSIQEIARFFGVPPAKLFQPGKEQRGNAIIQEDQAYINETVAPDLTMLEQKFNRYFQLPEEGLSMLLDPGTLMRADPQTRYNLGRIGVLSGLISPNEWRQSENLKPVEGGDEVRAPVNLAALGSDMTGTSPDGAGRPPGNKEPDPGIPNESGKGDRGVIPLRTIGKVTRSMKPNEKRRAVAHVRVAEGEADDITKVIASTNEIARDGWVVEPAGLKTANFLRSAAICFNHDYEHPVATPTAAALIEGGDKLEITIQWPPQGTSPKSDEVRSLVKAKVIRAVSIGFMPLEMEPLDPKEPWGGQRVLSADLLEVSFVAVPADTGAVVTQRSPESSMSQRAGEGGDWKCGVSRTLPIDDSDGWDGPAAEKAIFEWAGGDDFDPAKARKAFLAYDASKPKERGSYKLPIAHVVEGRLRVPKGAIRAAASRLPGTQVPDDVKAEARKVLDHYEEKAGMGKDNTDGDRSIGGRIRRLSKAVKDHLAAALRHHDRAATHHKALGDHLEAMSDHMEEARAAHEKARAAHDSLGEALDSVRGDPERSAEHLERAIKLHGTVEKHHRSVREAHNDIAGAHEDAESAADDLGRSMDEAHDAVKRAVGDDNVPGDVDAAAGKDADTDAVQVSNGTQQEAGATGGRSAAWRQRRARLLELDHL
jgi:HK97 family phage portal protein/HK97 family phage prohead protease